MLPNSTPGDETLCTVLPSLLHHPWFNFERTWQLSAELNPSCRRWESTAVSRTGIFHTFIHIFYPDWSQKNTMSNFFFCKILPRGRTLSVCKCLKPCRNKKKGLNKKTKSVPGSSWKFFIICHYRSLHWTHQASVMTPLFWGLWVIWATLLRPTSEK